MNLYYEPTKMLTDYIDKCKGFYIPINCGNLKIPSPSDWCKKNVQFEDEMQNNISYLNPKLNEMTAIYAYWKNFKWKKLDYIGFNHYRRIFKLDQLQDCKKYDAMVMKSIPMRIVKLKPGIVEPKSRDDVEIVSGTIEQGYDVCHNINDFKIMENVVKQTSFGKYFDEWKNQSILNAPCNMFFMKKDMFDSYCKYIFKILFNLEMKIYLTGRDNYQKRALAFLSERLTSLFFYNSIKNGKKVKEIDTLFLENFRPNTAKDNRGDYTI